MCEHVRVCVCVCTCVCVCEDEGVYMFWSPCSIITIIFPFTSAPVNDDDVWELHTWESDVFMWRAVQDWVLKSVRVHGMHTSPSSRKQHRNTGANKREKVLIAREFLESLAKLPSHYCRKDSQKLYLETLITSCTHLNKAFQEYCDSKGKLRVSRQVYSRKWRCKTLPYTNNNVESRTERLHSCSLNLMVILWALAHRRPPIDDGQVKPEDLCQSVSFLWS